MKKFGLRIACGLALSMLTGISSTRAAELPQRDLYQDALQSIAEGRKSDASEALSRVINQEPLHAGAWLDLALIQCSLGHAAEAERLFATIESRFTPPQGIIDLINQARAEKCDNWQSRSHVTFAIGRGSDQNVNQGASNPYYIFRDSNGSTTLPLLPDFLPKHDLYTSISTEYVRDISSNGSIGFAQFQARRNDTLHDFDTGSLFVGIETPWRFGAWTVRGTGMFGLISLGGALYQRQTQLQMRVGPPLPLPDSVQFNFLAGVSHIDYVNLSNFNSNTIELRGQLQYRGKQNSVSASLGFMDDRAGASRPGGNRQGWLTSIQGRQRLSDSLTGEIGYSRQTWLSQSAYLPGLITEVRDQKTHVLRAALIYPTGANQHLQLEVRQVRNAENISIFEYNNRQIQISWQWQGF